MALGQTYDKEDFRPSVYGIAFRNDSDKAVDRTMISFSMWASTIKISIVPLVQEATKEFMTPNYEAAGSIWLTPSKAMIFANVISKFLEEMKLNPDKKNPYSGWAVFTKHGMIGIFDSKDMGSTAPCIVFKKVNANSGKVESSYAYEIKADGYDVIHSFNENTGTFSRNTEMFQYTELIMIIQQLEDYARASNNAYAFSVADSLAYGLNQLQENIVRIGKNMGIDMIMPKGSKTGGGSSKAFFDKNRNEKTPSASDVQKKIGSIDELMDV